MRRVLVLAVLAGLMGLNPARMTAATNVVQVSDNSFSPTSTRVAQGGSVRWRREGGGNPHNIAQDGGLFHSGAATSGAIDFTVTFSAGTFPYYCEVHGGPGGIGMSGVVRVPVKTLKKPAGKPFTVRWATGGSETGDTYRVQYRVGKGPWKTWKAATSALKGVFGKRGKPVRLKAGKSYAFRARSSDGSAASRFSPPNRFRLSP